MDTFSLEKFKALLTTKFALPIIAVLGLVLMILIVKLQPNMKHEPAASLITAVNYVEVQSHIIAPEIVGYGATSDGYDMVAPSGEGAVRCMQQAMQGVEGEIDYLNTHGTSTPVGDVKELGAIQELFGEKSPAISATKAMTGHALGAAGVHEAIYSILMMENSFVAPSINVDNLDEQAQGLDIVTEKRDAELNLIMSNSFGFGGTNATLVMQKYKS